MAGELDLIVMGRRLRRARLRQCLTQEELAARVGLNVHTCGKLERGQAWPSVRTLWRLCAELKVSADVLLGFRSSAAGDTPWPEDSPELRLLLRRLHGARPERLRLAAMLLGALDAENQD